MEPSYNTNVLGTMIEERLEALDWTQAALANKLGIAQQTVSKWITGQTTPRPGTLRSVADRLQVEYELLARAAYGMAQAPTFPPQPDAPPAPLDEELVAVPVVEGDPTLAALNADRDLSEEDRETVIALVKRLRGR